MLSTRTLVEHLSDKFTLDDVGSSLLQDLARGLYHRHETVREYVQNAVDAHRLFAHLNGVEPGGPIQIEVGANKLSFLDRGVGMPEKEIRRVKSIAVSKKANADIPLTGHKGVGIWAGLSYFEKLTILSTSLGDPKAFELIIHFGRIARAISDEASIDQVLNNNYEINAYEEDPNEHYTDVSLEGPVGQSREWFLDADRIRDAVRRYCPCQLDPTFGLNQEATKWYQEHGFEFFDITVDGEPVYRSYPSAVEGFRQDRISIEDKPVAYYWYAINRESEILKPRDEQLIGLRIVQNGFVLGSDNLYSEDMQEFDRLKLENYLKWYIGEIHVVASDLRPDLQRRRFEEAEPTRQFIKRCRSVYQDFADDARRASALRARRNEYKGYEDEIEAMIQKGAPLSLTAKEQARIVEIRKTVQEHEERLKAYKGKLGQKPDERTAALKGTKGDRTRVLNKIDKLVQMPMLPLPEDAGTESTKQKSSSDQTEETTPRIPTAKTTSDGPDRTQATKSATNRAETSSCDATATGSATVPATPVEGTRQLVLVDVLLGLVIEVLREELPDTPDLRNRIAAKLSARISTLVENGS